MKKIVIWAVIAAFAPAVANAGYVANRATWDQLGAAGKAIYAMGVYDSSNILFGADDNETLAIKKARIRCLAEEAFTPDRLAALADQAYKADPSLASQAPSTILIGQVSAHCERQIREEKAKLGPPTSK